MPRFGSAGVRSGAGASLLEHDQGDFFGEHTRVQREDGSTAPSANPERMRHRASSRYIITDADVTQGVCCGIRSNKNDEGSMCVRACGESMAAGSTASIVDPLPSTAISENVAGGDLNALKWKYTLTCSLIRFDDEQAQPCSVQCQNQEVDTLLGPYMVCAITSYTEYRHIFPGMAFLIDVWPAAPFYHAFVLLEVDEGAYIICLEKFSDQLRLMFGENKSNQMHDYALHFLGNGRERSTYSKDLRPIRKQQVEQLAGNIEVRHICQWLAGDLGMIGQTYDLISKNCQYFSHDLKRFLLDPSTNPAYKDRHIVLRAVKKHGHHVLKNASCELKSDPVVMLTALQHSSDALQHAGDSLLADLVFCKRAIQIQPTLLTRSDLERRWSVALDRAANALALSSVFKLILTECRLELPSSTQTGSAPLQVWKLEHETLHSFFDGIWTWDVVTYQEVHVRSFIGAVDHVYSLLEANDFSGGEAVMCIERFPHRLEMTRGPGTEAMRTYFLTQRGTGKMRRQSCSREMTNRVSIGTDKVEAMKCKELFQWIAGVLDLQERAPVFASRAFAEELRNYVVGVEASALKPKRPSASRTILGEDSDYTEGYASATGPLPRHNFEMMDLVQHSRQTLM